MNTSNRQIGNPPKVLLITVFVIASLTLGILVDKNILIAVFLAFGFIGAIVYLGFVCHPLWFLYTFAFFLPFQAELSVPQLWGATLTPLNLLNIVMLAILLARFLFSQHIRRLPYRRWWYAFILLTAISFGLGPHVVGPLQGVWVIFRLAIVPPLAYLGIHYFLHNPSLVRKVVAVLVFSASIAGTIALVQVISGGQILGGIVTNQRYLGTFQPLPEEALESLNKRLSLLYVPGMNIYRGHGTFYIHNVLGSFLSVTICMTWGLMRSARGANKWKWLLVLTAQIAGLIASFSRSAVVAAVTGLVVAIVLELAQVGGKRAVLRATRLALFGVLVAPLVLYAVLTLEPIKTRFATLFSLSEVAELEWRLLVWEFIIQQIIDRWWLGHGTALITQVPSYFANANFSPHNIMFELSYRNGLIVLITFLFFVWKFFSLIWNRNKKSQLDAETIMFIGFLASGVAFLVAGMANSFMSNENMASLFWFMMGMAVVINRTRKPR